MEHKKSLKLDMGLSSERIPVFQMRMERSLLRSRHSVIQNPERHSFVGVTFVHGLHAPVACCWILRFQILFMQKA